jgi:hypothetical protein
MAGLLDLLGQAAGCEIAFNAKRAGYCQRVLHRGLIKPTHVPKGVSAVFRKGLVVKAQVFGLDRFNTHDVIICSAMIVGKLKTVWLQKAGSCLLMVVWVGTLSAADDFGAVYGFGGVAGVYD